MGTHPIFESDFDCLTEMESNRDAADQCYAKAVAALKVGDVDKAKRMAEKSIRLFETTRATEFLEQLKTINMQPKTERPESDNVRQRKPNPEPAEGSPKAKNYTPEQLQAVNKILSNKKDYYKVLGLEKGASPAEIKKAYRKAALKLHPDKNTAPRADEAFKVVGKAFSVLTDDDKKSAYERYGADGPQVEHHHRGPRRGHHGDFYDDDINPEDIFNMFFGGMPPGHRMGGRRRTYHFQSNHGAHQRAGHHETRQNARRNAGSSRESRFRDESEEGESVNNLGAWLQFMPLLVLIGLSLISNLMTPDPLYTLSRHGNRGYTQKIFTEQDRIAYFVQPGFETNYPKGSKERGKIERSVRNDYIENLRNNCYQETLHAEHKLRRAQLYGDSKMVQQAQQTPRPNCKRLDDIQNNAAAGG